MEAVKVNNIGIALRRAGARQLQIHVGLGGGGEREDTIGGARRAAGGLYPILRECPREQEGRRVRSEALPLKFRQLVRG